VSELQNALVFAHRANINRYRRLLQTSTYLTANERQFIERRLAEEESALMEIPQKTAPVDRHTMLQGLNLSMHHERQG
jgi:hypothetical protein